MTKTLRYVYAVDIRDPSTTDKQREGWCRRRAAAEGLKVCKSRKDGTFMLVDLNSNVMVAGDPNGYGMTLDDLVSELRK